MPFPIMVTERDWVAIESDCVWPVVAWEQEFAPVVLYTEATLERLPAGTTLARRGQRVWQQAHDRIVQGEPLTIEQLDPDPGPDPAPRASRIKEGIRTILSHAPEGQLISQAHMARHLRCSSGTVSRACRSLAEAGEIVNDGGGWELRERYEARTRGIDPADVFRQ